MASAPEPRPPTPHRSQHGAPARIEKPSAASAAAPQVRSSRSSERSPSRPNGSTQASQQASPCSPKVSFFLSQCQGAKEKKRAAPQTPCAGAWVELCLPAQLSPCRDRWPMRAPPAHSRSRLPPKIPLLLQGGGPVSANHSSQSFFLPAHPAALTHSSFMALIHPSTHSLIHPPSQRARPRASLPESPFVAGNGIESRPYPVLKCSRKRKNPYQGRRQAVDGI